MPQVLALAAQAKDRAPLAVSCIDMPLDEVERRCMIGRGPPTAAIWGNSHASADSAGIAQTLAQPTVVLAPGGCAQGASPKGDPGDGCTRRNRAVLDWIRRRQAIDTIVFAAHWQGRRKVANAEQWHAVQAAIEMLPGRRVIVLTGAPEPGLGVPWASAIRASRGLPPLRLECPPALES